MDAAINSILILIPYILILTFIGIIIWAIKFTNKKQDTRSRKNNKPKK